VIRSRAHSKRYGSGVLLKNKTQAKDQPKLRVIQGGRRFEMSLGPLLVVAAPEDAPPFVVDAVAAEEDTFLVLSAEPVVREPHIHPVRLWTQAIEIRPQKPGSVLVRGKRPLRLLAIVHDLNQDPSWREEWIASALDGIFREAESRKLPSIALPLLGTKHGSLEKQRFVVLLQDALERASCSHPKRLWLVIPDGTSCKILEMIESELRR
jgi:hypothetical protein